MVDTAAIPTLASSAPAPATGDSLMPNPGPDPDNELTDAKIAAAEARTDTKLRDVDVKFERVLGEVRLGFQELRTDMASVRLGFQELRTDMAAFKGEVGTQLAAFKGEVRTQLAAMPTRAEARSNMQWIIGTLAALIVAVAGLIIASFQTGFALGSPPQKPVPVEASAAQSQNAPAPVEAPLPGSAAPATRQPGSTP